MPTPFGGSAILITLFNNLTAAQLTAQNRVLRPNEMAIESDTGKIKVGNGSTAWTSLGYLSSVSTVVNFSADYTLTINDALNIIVHPASDNNARTLTIPANSAVPFPIGTIIYGSNGINTVTMAITTDTLQYGASSTGSRTLAAGSDWMLKKIAATTWRLSGSLIT